MGLIKSVDSAAKGMKKPQHPAALAASEPVWEQPSLPLLQEVNKLVCVSMQAGASHDPLLQLLPTLSLFILFFIFYNSFFLLSWTADHFTPAVTFSPSLFLVFLFIWDLISCLARALSALKNFLKTIYQNLIARSIEFCKTADFFSNPLRHPLWTFCFFHAF